MPLYEYECRTCGPFEAARPMAEASLPGPCPGCGAAAPRAFLTAPNFAALSATTRTAFATNERSRHEPKRASGHGPACGCCSGKKSRAARAPNGAKSFPSQRPWMISH